MKIHTKFLLAFIVNYICIFWSYHALAIQLPKFELPIGTNVAAIDESADIIVQYQGAESLYQITERNWFKHFGRTGDNSYWLTMREERTRQGNSDIRYQEFEPGISHGINVKYDVHGDDVTIDNQGEEALTEEQLKGIESWAKGRTWFHILTDTISNRDFQIGIPYNFNEKDIDAFQGQGSITLKNIQKKWQEDIAEFQVVLTENHNFPQLTIRKCEYHIWVHVKTGRPIQLIKACLSDASSEGQNFSVYQKQKRNFAYNDFFLSEVSPVPTPNIQPLGDITGIGYSKALQQVLFSTWDIVSDQTWLNIWDIHQRKVIQSFKTRGKLFSKPDDGEVVHIASKNRFTDTYLEFVDAYTNFGGTQPHDFSLPDYHDITSLGNYLLALSDDNKLDLHSGGYGAVWTIGEIEGPQYNKIFVTEDQRVVTANKNGLFAIHQLDLKPDCPDTEITDGFCNKMAGSMNQNLFKFQLSTNEMKEQELTLEHLSIHPDHPIIGYCHIYSCGLINYETQLHIPLEAATFHFIKGQDNFYTDEGIYNLQGELIERFYAYDSGSESFLASPEQGVYFAENRNFDEHIKSGYYIYKNNINMRSLKDGHLMDSIASTATSIEDLFVLSDTEIMLQTESTSLNPGSVFTLNLTTLEKQQQALPIPIIQASYAENQIALTAKDQTVVVSEATPDKPHVIESKTVAPAFVDGHFYFADDNRIQMLDHDTGLTKTVKEYSSTIKDFLILDPQSTKIATILEDGDVILSMGTDITLTSISSTPNTILSKGQKDDFLIINALDKSGLYRSDMGQIFHIDGKGFVSRVMQPIWASYTTATLDHEGKLWVGTTDGEIFVWDLTSGILLYSFSAHNAHITKLATLNDGIVISTSRDGSINLWRTDIPTTENVLNHMITDLLAKGTSKRLFHLIGSMTLSKDGEFVISSHDGYHWGTPIGLHRALFNDDGEDLDYRQYDFWMNRPDVILRKIGLASEEELLPWQKLVEVRQNRHPDYPQNIPSAEQVPSLKISGPDKIEASEKIQISWQIEETNTAPDKLHVMVNDVPIYGYQGLNIKDTSGEIEILLTEGINRIRAYVSTPDGLPSPTEYLTYNKRETQTKPDLYMLAIGVSDYLVDDLDLNYASKDAQDLSGLLSEAGSYETVHVQKILDTAATKQNILNAKNFLEQAQPDDRVVVFFAGHGFLDVNNDYYFGTTDIDPWNPALQGLSYENINQLLDGLPSRFKLLLLDTCHSGEVTEFSTTSQVAENVQARGFELEEPTRENADIGLSFQTLRNTFVDLNSSTGATVISAAGGREFAFETDEASNGVFTSTILRGLKERAADTDQNGDISVEELRAYTYSEVSRLTFGQQQPTTREQNLEVDFSIF